MSEAESSWTLSLKLHLMNQNASYGTH